ncbi:MAG: MerR family transcriptional regulator [Treponema sp.]|nr:MerR family transcriptional regulator [Treponema sp.]
MAQYSIGEVEQLTGIKPYVLRYWEEVIPCFAPQKDISGRRIYTQREIDIIRRLKFLIYTKRYTIDGARSQIIQETALADSNANALQAIHEIRAELGSLYLMLKKRTRQTQHSAKKDTADEASS